MFVFLFILLFGLTFAYQFLLDIFFTSNGVVNYEYLLKYGIQVASEDNYFMNYGYWKKAKTIHEANRELVTYCMDMSDLKGKEGLNILDVGCGYGEQDFLWLKKLPSTTHITAVDISEKQIEAAKEKAIENNLEDRLTFQTADACALPFKPQSFDAAFCIESAFHYPCRPRFFKDVHHILNNQGTFVICDIMLQDGYKPNVMGNSFLKLFSDLLSIPKQNLITSSEWESQIKKAGFHILKSRDITSLTFEPYYECFFEQWFQNLYMPKWFATPFKFFFTKSQPFTYRILVCQKE